MRPLLLVLVGLGAVLAAGLRRGDTGALVALLALALMGLVAVVWTLPLPQRRKLVAAGEVHRQPRFPSYDRLYGAIVLSSNSARHVDLTLRPVVLRVLAAELDDDGPEAVRARLGERWWSLVDPDRPAASDNRTGGLDRRSLRDLLDKLEDR